MDREILFRGMNDNKCLVQGYFFQTWKDCFILWGTTNGVPNMTKVDPATVGQFTGLCDKNGVKIFEGDILRDGLGDDGVVTYFESIASFKYQVGNEVWNLNEGDPNRSTQLQYTEIIGNIHDNPELVKEEAE